jgi:hypothetical protein
VRGKTRQWSADTEEAMYLLLDILLVLLGATMLWYRKH